MVLYIDTTRADQVAVGLAQGSVWQTYRQWRERSLRAERLLPMIDRLLTQRGQSRPRIRGIVVVRGPASFTAARTGVVVANALSAGWQVPVVGVRRTGQCQSTEQLLAAGEQQLQTAALGKWAQPIYQSAPTVSVVV